jgi:hypothetical protein
MRGDPRECREHAANCRELAQRTGAWPRCLSKYCGPWENRPELSELSDGTRIFRLWVALLQVGYTSLPSPNPILSRLRGCQGAVE